jgi:4-diphosphocytidyl-2-C-methyl-D-erythritol kinase
MTLRAPAHAKLNLALAVVGRRDDGYHELRSVFARLALHDELSVELARDPDGPDRIVVHGDAAVPVLDNIVLSAAAAVRRVIESRPDLNVDLPALDFTLVKHIPMRAGLAGGSSDAAAAIDLALHAWGMPLDANDRSGVAASLGADVPFFVGAAPAALVSGVGERLEPLPTTEPPVGVVLVSPNGGLSTASVFAAYDAEPPAPSGASATVDGLVSILREGGGGAAVVRLLDTTAVANDLWSAAAGLEPALEPLRHRLAQASGRNFHLTGSGSTLFSIRPTLASPLSLPKSRICARRLYDSKASPSRSRARFEKNSNSHARGNRSSGCPGPRLQVIGILDENER